MKKFIAKVAYNIVLRDITKKIIIKLPYMDMPAMQEKVVEDYERKTPLTQFAVKQAEKILKKQKEEKNRE